MKRSGHLHQTPMVRPRRESVRLDLFRLESVSSPPRGRSAKRPMWRSKNPLGRVFLVLYLFFLAIIALVALSEASAPRSRGARPVALGGGYTAEAGDTYSLFYNPAGLAELNREQVSFDYGRTYSVGGVAMSDFSGIYGFPWRYQDHFLPLAIGIYGERPVQGAHIVDLSIGGGSDAPVDRWTKGFIKRPVKLGAALNIRQQQGDDLSPRVGGARLAFGLSVGAYMPVNRTHQVGAAIRHLYVGDGDPRGASLHVGVKRFHLDYLNMLAELELVRGGVWRFNPGLEWLFARGVVRPRLGWGFRDAGGVDLVATGIGFYLSPLQMDVTYLVPVKTLNDNAGQIRTSLIYRFGQPQFSEVYYDRALEAAGRLDVSVVDLSVREAELKASLSELEQKNRLAGEELANLKSRIDALRDRDVLGQKDAEISRLRGRVQELERRMSSQQERVRQARERQATVRTHLIRAGDTLQSLAREYYGDPNQWRTIFNANVDKIDRGLPRVGTTFVIP